MFEGDHRGVVGNPAGHAQRRGVRQVGIPCSAGRSWVSISTGRRPVLRCTRALISTTNPEHAASSSAKVAYCPSRFVSVGTMSALASLTAFSTPPLDAGRRVTRQYRDAVVAPEGDGRAVADRDPGDVSGGDGLLVVGEQVGRCAAQDAEDPVQSREDTGCGPIPHGDDDPVSAPRQPRHQSTTLRPTTIGPSPKSYCSHSPGSVTTVGAPVYCPVAIEI